MNGQIVLCRDINDGAELERTISDLTRYIPCMESVSVVPVGLSKYRDGLYPLKPFEKESAAAAIEIIERWQKKIYAEHGIHFIHASDEFYLLAERELPEEERYDGYPQLENGVGMLRLLDTEVNQALEEMSDNTQIEAQTLSLATGRLAFPTMQRQIAKITAKYPQIKVNLYAIRNDFFGEMITVSGLVTGQDIKKQLSGCELGSRLRASVQHVPERRRGVPG